jgi:addiction module RelE/StbE family toxin
MKIFYHPRFKRTYKKLSAEIKSKAEIKEVLFRDNPFDSRLDTHKLHGKLKNQWSFSVDKKYRILFEFDNSDVIFLDIGDHNLYK